MEWTDELPPLNLLNYPSFYIKNIMHPLILDLSGLTNEELHAKYNDLVKKFNQAYRFGPTSVIPQMQMAMQNYQQEMDNRNRKTMEDMEKKGDKFKGIIDIQ